MPSRFSFIVVVRFGCPACGGLSEHRGAIGADEDTAEAIQKAVDATVPRCQNCHTPVTPATKLYVEVLQKQA